MCGRYTLKIDGKDLAALFALPELPDFPHRYNIAPTQRVAMIRMSETVGDRQLAMVRWGFIPAWAKEMPSQAPLINARLETAHEKPTFRSSFQSRRCLIPADGFYEWRRSTDKQPFVFQLPDEQPFAFAGLWDRWQGPDGQIIESCAMLTTEANMVMAPIHHRMPTILPPTHYDAWLDPGHQHPERLRAVLAASLCDRLIAKAVSTRVNKAVNDDPACLAPPEPAPLSREMTLFD
ncbi:MAG: SOS response-associated peptidase [Candidatus Sericytochromatia bacterium]|nr:SOS response-associated peptidase [Candidatus Sericytochromatia bacterium]